MTDGRKWVWKMKGEGLSDRLVQGTLKYGGGHVMLWGCFGWDGVYACKIDGNMDADLYVSILEDELQESLNYWGKNPQQVVFQQDNDPKCTSKKARAWLKDHGFEVMVWSHNPLISIPLSIYGITSRGSLESMRRQREGWRSGGREIRRNEIIVRGRSVGK